MPDYDVVIVGGGFSAMSAALAAKEKGVNVALVSKVYSLRSHSSGAHSGINAALTPEDSWEAHALDSVKAGGYLADQDAVEIMCREGIQEVIHLEHLGITFSRDERGAIDTMSFAGSSHPRTCYSGDSAGHIILQVLYEQVLRRRIPTHNEWFVTSLLVEDGVCRGVLAQEQASGSLNRLNAKAVILATGGLGRMYQPSTSAFTATADGVALAYRAGVPLMDMEMVQYHPTTLKGRGLVVTEAARGQGARLVNKDGDAFMESYAPGAGDMAPRDVCARAVATEVSEGRGVDGCVFLDFQHLDQAVVGDLLPETQLLVKRLAGIDLTKELVPVQPAMHRPIGGIQTDVNGATSVGGLYAAGECASTGVHGANRLGGNTLLECAVFGRRAGEAAAARAQASRLQTGSETAWADEERRVREAAGRDGGEDTIGSIRGELAQTMHGNVGLYRDEEGLRQALGKVEGLKERYARVSVPGIDGPYNPSLAALLELGNMLDVAQVVAASALARQESRGAHYRTDYPRRDDATWLRHTVAFHSPQGPALADKPVVVTQWPPDGAE